MKKSITIPDAMEKAMNDFLDNPDIIFADDTEHLKFRYGAFDKLKDWKKNRNCIVKNCSNISIERSHTIQKAGSIKQIAEKGYVLSPAFNYKTEKIELKKIGINEASTFPGYCNLHENLFNNFEQAKDLKTDEDFGLQLYRTVCREIIINKNHLKRFDSLVSSYKIFRDKKIQETTIAKLDHNIFESSPIKIKKISIESFDYRLKAVSERRKEIIRYLNEFLYIYHNAILHDLQKKKFGKIAFIGMHFDVQIPVAIAGRGNFIINLRTKRKNIEVIFNVLPYEDKTYIIISSLKKNSKQLSNYMSYFAWNSLQVINMIESWMIHGTDHWFLKPSVWNSLNFNLQRKILDKSNDFKYNIGNELEYTIFKEIKMEVIQEMENNYEKLTQPLIDLLQKEKIKFDL
ncbi:hypothetical protein B0A79_24900 [Flavobacterium piscis]|uniref:Uncharacterized protein n=1 Tax=Flavobacterium piscis TaxID=1114874 RepID=A0ABX2XGT9_9FLAO|nr:hypothetical protein [Flavobacterium piscis]OCB73168.1 hypothetical protein FLP_10620 [Flavobacterium piscis]OXE95148.1 hypothetical protein B0A79_24900 [Flavobacterium piscis]